VQDATVSIRKELSRFSSVVTMTTTRGDVLRIAIGPTGAIADTGTSSSPEAVGQPMAGQRVMATIKSSPAARAARALLTKLTLDPSTPVGNAMLLTRALLEASQEEGLSALDHQKWARTSEFKRSGCGGRRRTGRLLGGVLAVCRGGLG
jgi:hypothetical protein